MGNYEGVKSIKLENEHFNHAVWIIPVATVAILGIIFGVLMLLKHIRRKRRLKGISNSEASSSDGATQTPKGDDSTVGGE